MKIKFRKPSLTRRISARTSGKRFIRHNLGFKAPRGWGWVTNPRRALYNRVYNRTTFGLFRLSFGGRRSNIRNDADFSDFSDFSDTVSGRSKFKRGVFMVLGAALLLGWCSDTSKKKTDNGTYNIRPAATVTKPVTEYVSPKIAPTKQDGQEWQQAVKQANAQAVKDGLASNRQPRPQRNIRPDRKQKQTVSTQEKGRTVKLQQEWLADNNVRMENRDSGGWDNGRYGAAYRTDAPVYAGSRSHTDSSNKTVNVRGYYRKDGTYVQPHTRSPRK